MRSILLKYKTFLQHYSTLLRQILGGGVCSSDHRHMYGVLDGGLLVNLRRNNTPYCMYIDDLFK